jgi:hypothetical protein
LEIGTAWVARNAYFISQLPIESMETVENRKAGLEQALTPFPGSGMD